MLRIRIVAVLFTISAVAALAVPLKAIFSAASEIPLGSDPISSSQNGGAVAGSAVTSMSISDQHGYLYVISDRTSGNQIFGYQVNETTGALTALPGFPVATGGNGEGATASQLITVDRANSRLYAINDGSNTLSAFSINAATGALTPMPFSPITIGSGFWLTVAVHPSGSPVIVGDGGSTPSVQSYHVTDVSAVEASGSPYTLVSARPFSSAFSRDGSYYYAGGNEGNFFAGYSVNQTTGALTALPGSPYNSGGTFPLGFATDTQGRIFSINGSSQLRSFTTASGIPSGVSGNPFTSGLNDGIDGVLSPDGNFFYAADRGNNRLGAYQIAGTGPSTTLTAVAGSPVASGGQLTNALAFNKSGGFLYATNGFSRNITTFSVNPATGFPTVNNIQNANTLGVSGTLSGIVYFTTATTPTPTPTPTPSPTPSPSPTPQADLVASKINDLSGDEVWTRQFGTTGGDSANAITADSAGNIYIFGQTDGTFPGQVGSGALDAFVRRYDPAGTEVWTRQFGTSDTDRANGIAVDTSGNIYIAGNTAGTLPGQTSSGNNDAFVRKYDSAGNVVWTRQFGTSGEESAASIAVDGSGNIFIAGRTSDALPGQISLGGNDAFVRKYDAAGNVVWTKQFGTSGADEANGIGVDAAGNSYIGGHTSGILPGETNAGSFDAFVRKYDAAGNEVWDRQFGSSGFDSAFAIAVDSAGNSFSVGRASGPFPGQTSAGNTDGFLRKYDTAGNEMWTRQFGSSSSDDANSVAVDAVGNSYVAGLTNGTFPGQSSSGASDAFVRRYDASGTEVWTRQFGSSNFEEANGVAIDAAGNSYVAGPTSGVFPGQTSAGGGDAFVRKYSGNVADCAPWTWTVKTSNKGASPAVFSSGDTIVLDDLPGSGLTYATPVVGSLSGITGNISASVVGNTLMVTAANGVTIAPGGSFTVSFTATPTANGTYVNPVSGGMAKVDPNNVIAESNEANNTFTDSVMVTGCAMEPFVDIAGQVLTSDGRGLRGATVSLTDEQGEKRSVLTSSLGFYTFEDVANGSTVVISVVSKRFRFLQRTLEVSGERTDVDFVGIE